MEEATPRVGEVRIDELPDGMIPEGSGWEFIIPVYAATWLALLGYAIYLRIRRVPEPA